VLIVKSVHASMCVCVCYSRDVIPVDVDSNTDISEKLVTAGDSSAEQCLQAEQAVNTDVIIKVCAGRWSGQQ